MRKKLIVANWKMNHGTEDTLKFLTHFKRKAHLMGAVKVALCPPLTSLYAASVYLSETELPVFLGAQNCHWEEKGAFTGEVSASFLKELGCQFVIVGHSERRHQMGETAEQSALKAIAVFKQGLSPIFCVGETRAEREAGQTQEVVLGQLEVLLSQITVSELVNLVIAYEPVWAIGTGLSATADQADEVHRFIRQRVAEWASAEAASRMTILYGGSVSPSNIKDLISRPDIDGALVGGASLEVDSLMQIVHDASLV